MEKENINIFEQPQPRYTKENPLVRDAMEDALPIVTYGENRELKGLCVEEYSIKDTSLDKYHTVYKLLSMEGDGESPEVTVINGEPQFNEGERVSIERSNGDIQDATVVDLLIRGGRTYTQVEFPVDEGVARKNIPTAKLRALNSAVETGKSSTGSSEEEPETEQETYERFVRELKADLDSLYEQYRGVEQGSDEQFYIQKQIDEVKTDINKWAKKAGYI